MNVICYVDGFNLYHGLRSKGWREVLLAGLVGAGGAVSVQRTNVKRRVYCTAKVKKDPDALKRQMTFIDALKAYRPNLKVEYGHYLAKEMNCFKCGNTYIRHEER